MVIFLESRKNYLLKIIELISWNEIYELFETYFYILYCLLSG